MLTYSQSNHTASHPVASFLVVVMNDLDSLEVFRVIDRVESSQTDIQRLGLA